MLDFYTTIIRDKRRFSKSLEFRIRCFLYYSAQIHEITTVLTNRNYCSLLFMSIFDVLR